MTFTHIIKFLLPQVCVLCKVYDRNLSLCSNCVKDLQPAAEVGVNWIYSVYSYKDENFKKIIYSLKYHHKYDLADSLMFHLSTNFTNFIKKYIEFNKMQHSASIVLVPIPISPDRLVARGYNQSELIAQAFIKYLPNQNISVQNLIKRKGISIKLSHLHSVEERAATLNDTIYAETSLENKENTHLNPKDTLYVLVDDVTTTGSTLYAARKALTDTGIDPLHVIAITVGH